MAADQRVRRAQELLGTTDTRVEANATATGMRTATTLRRPLHRRAGPPLARAPAPERIG
ncbi:hypothetical protein FB563_0738 [Streptomyces puniciscabiei]|uniref:Uncharacterized protein n=1 Tax=Streptomyces puniciscabiei TaxID=164348 RepID=A0A542U9V7_9ACTN|nr:hypothetical protein [Streptomyces puniciscabiei]TQK95818.1 hypothetical protein FB563_0738 [Streptomyces puniciscabiei]